MENQEQAVPVVFWKREITFGQFLGILIGLLVAFATGMYDARVELREHKVRIATLEQGHVDLGKAMKEGFTDVKAEQRIQTNKQDQLLIQMFELNNKK